MDFCFVFRPQGLNKRPLVCESSRSVPESSVPESAAAVHKSALRKSFFQCVIRQLTASYSRNLPS